MTDEEMAEEYIKGNCIRWEYDSLSVDDIAKENFLAGLEAGRVKWHDLRKDSEDLPETLHPVYAKLDSGTYAFAYCVNKIWHGNDDGIILHHGNGECEVIAWTEILRFEET